MTFRSKISGFIDSYFEVLSISLTLAVIFLIVLVPAIYVIYSSFFKIDLSYAQTKESFIGLSNYFHLLSDPYFWKFLSQNLIYTIGSLVVSFFPAFVCALALNQIARFKGFFRGIVMLPWVIPPVVAALLWRWIFNDSYGLINALLSPFISPVLWLGNTKIAMFSVIITDAWTRIPFMTIFLLAGLQAIPNNLYEAAKMDGANIFTCFRHITLPLLKSTIVLLLLIMSIFIFRTYVIIGGLTRGGPAQATETLTTYIFRLTTEYWNIGYGSALSTFVLIFILAWSFLYLRIFYKGEGF